MKTYYSHSTRTALTQSIPIPKCKKENTKKSLFPSTIRSWNSLNPQCREAHTQSQISTLIWEDSNHYLLQCPNYTSQ